MSWSNSILLIKISRGAQRRLAALSGAARAALERKNKNGAIVNTKTISAITLVIFLSSCGFTPLYEKKAETAELADFLASMQIITSGKGNRLEQLVREHVEDLLHGQGHRKSFTLGMDVTQLEYGVGISPDGKISRYTVSTAIKYTVTRMADGVVFDTGNVQVQTGYNAVVSADYATYAARDDAIKRATSEIAESLRSRLITTFYGIDSKPSSSTTDKNAKSERY